MSVVTDVILCVGLGEEQGDDNFPAIDVVNEWLEREGYGKLNHLNGHEGGHKAWQIDVFGGAFNHLHAEEFVRRLLSAPWQEREYVQLVIQGEEDEAMEMVYLFPSQHPPMNRKIEEVREIIQRLGAEWPEAVG